MNADCDWASETFLIVAYYTKDTIYEDHARHLESSLSRYDVPYYIQEVPNLGTWLKNTSYKPTFLLSMLTKFPQQNIVYVDVDAEFLQYPVLFETLPELMTYDVAAYIFDRSCYNKSVKGFELLSGTLFFKNTEESKNIIERWEQRSQQNPNEWDQKSLEHVLGESHDLLPGAYCKIFDRMETVIEPVIVHYQASREIRRNHGKLL